MSTQSSEKCPQKISTPVLRHLPHFLRKHIKITRRPLFDSLYPFCVIFMQTFSCGRLGNPQIRTSHKGEDSRAAIGNVGPTGGPLAELGPGNKNVNLYIQERVSLGSGKHLQEV